MCIKLNVSSLTLVDRDYLLLDTPPCNEEAYLFPDFCRRSFKWRPHEGGIKHSTLSDYISEIVQIVPGLREIAGCGSPRAELGMI